MELFTAGGKLDYYKKHWPKQTCKIAHEIKEALVLVDRLLTRLLASIHTFDPKELEDFILPEGVPAEHVDQALGPIKRKIAVVGHSAVRHSSSASRGGKGHLSLLCRLRGGEGDTGVPRKISKPKRLRWESVFSSLNVPLGDSCSSETCGRMMLPDVSLNPTMAPSAARTGVAPAGTSSTVWMTSVVFFSCLFFFVAIFS